MIKQFSDSMTVSPGGNRLSFGQEAAASSSNAGKNSSDVGSKAIKFNDPKVK
jgi:hypothetical protein